MYQKRIATGSHWIIIWVVLQSLRWHRLHIISWNRNYQQLCIPVGCVLAACWPYPVLSRGGRYLPRGVSAQGEGCLLGWGLPRGCVCVGGCLFHCMLGYTYSPVNRITDRCKNITMPQTSFAGGNNVITLKTVSIFLPTMKNCDCECDDLNRIFP